MRGEEMRELGAVAGGALAQIGGLAKGIHGAVAQRTFGAPGPVGAPVRVMHDGISAVAYGSVSAGLRAVPRLTGAALGTAAPPDRFFIARGAPPTVTGRVEEQP